MPVRCLEEAWADQPDAMSDGGSGFLKAQMKALLFF